jgi:NDP-sugar pyrophosphorylase family protein
MPAKRRCLVLAAGFGTRMGSIGKRLPKVMWPVFEMSLLELQIRFARKLGYEEVFINLHHQADEIRKRTQNNPTFGDVRWLLEKPEILDIGGGIHNLASQVDVNYQGELLVLNSDQFLWFTAEELASWKAGAGDWDTLLLTLAVNSSQGYNQVKTDSRGRFLSVVPNAQLERNITMNTYSGNSVIRLDRLDPTRGPSAFFNSVARATKNVMTAQLKKGHYWDFGTADRYVRSMKGILDVVRTSEKDDFVSFLQTERALLVTKINQDIKSYGCDVPGLIHLGSGVPLSTHPAGVILAGEPCGTGTRASLIFESEVQYLD